MDSGLWQQMPFVEMENLANHLRFTEISFFHLPDTADILRTQFITISFPPQICIFGINRFMEDSYRR
jgi:hypothetical protein